MSMLTQAQAESVFGAMVQLNNVGGILHARLPLAGGLGRHIIVMEEIMSDDIVVSLYVGGANQGSERYANQNAFAAAYGLD
jgi:hypothetical protein